MRSQFTKMRDEFFKKFENGVNVVLSTSYNDNVSSRPVSVISVDGALYLTSIKRKGDLKNEQIEKNPNVAICFGKMQMQGTAIIDGFTSDTKNDKVMQIYKEKLPESYKLFASRDDCFLIKIDLLICKDWENINNDIRVTLIDFKNEKVGAVTLS